MTAEHHLIRNRSLYTSGGGRETHAIRCTCGESFRAATDTEAGLAWQQHRDGETPRSLAERFAAFHQAHPEVYDALVTLTTKAYDAGSRRLGIAMLFEVLRWEWMLSRLPADNEAWKLNNDYKSRYARLIMQNEEWAAGMFELRRLTA